jgi:hypothetical protein
MKISDQNSRQNGSNKNGKVNPRCDKCNKIPSKDNCLKCILNLHCLFNNDFYEDESLSVQEQIIKIKQDLDNLSPVPSLFIQIVEAYSDKKIKLEKKLLELSSKVEIKVDDSPNIEEKEPKIVRKKIPIIGKKGDVGQKIGFFFFNPKNKDGLHLPKIHVAAVVESFCESYKPIDGTEYSSRYLLDNINTGANKDLEEEN